MTKRYWLSAAATAALLMTASAASAATYETVFTGTVTGVDTFGLFGKKDASLDTTYKEVFTIDTSKGKPVQTSTSESISDTSRADPVSGMLTIDGVTVSVDGLGGQALVEATSKMGEIYDYAEGRGVDGDTMELKGEVLDNKSGAGFPTSFGAHYTLAVDGTKVIAPSANNIFEVLGHCGSADELLHLTPVSAAPEPSTWALMLAGVAGVGLAFRRKPSVSLVPATA